MKTRYIMIAAMTTLLAACSDDENKMDGPVEARVTASMGVETRAVNGDNTFEVNDEIGVMVTKVAPPEGTIPTPTSNMVDLYKNVKYIATTSGTPASFESQGKGIFFQDATEIVTFAAYYPYKESEDVSSLPGPGSNGVISVNTKENNGIETQKNIDFLFASGATAAKGYPIVRFNGRYPFLHKMAQLKLTVKASTEDGFTEQEAREVCSSNSTYSLTEKLIHEGTFTISVSDGKATGTAEAGATVSTGNWDITECVYQDSDDQMSRTYTLILLPQESPSFSFNATIGGQDYRTSKITPKLEAGKTCSYTIKVEKTKLIVEGCSIQPWEPTGETPEVPAEMW